ncbi:MAG: COX15/CtaA family protein [Casimicrobiaceae bacterium]|nr:COX15/CtaA family protein [Casimicrobiaceae bacterium]MDW8311978.1 COX15/CtaA family protein [Burkholderiales bacterium]
MSMTQEDPLFWQFSLTFFNLLAWVAILAGALWMGWKLSWGRLVAVTAFVTLDLIAFGAFVRLTDSGLGCPDWPGCYGKFLPTQAKAEIDAAIAEQGGTHGPVSHGKAWIEMLHRYVASFIGALIVAMVIRAAAARFHAADAAARARAMAPVGLGWPLLLLAVVLVQGLFGKWTVTLKLMPIVVTAHLLGGMTLFALLVWFWMRERARAGEDSAQRLGAPGSVRLWLWVAIAALYGQIFLGGWVSTNYAVMACPDFPGCHGSLLPKVDYAEGFALLRELGRNPDGTMLSIEGLRAIHWAHRLGAVAVTVIIVAAALVLMRRQPALRREALWIKSALLVQLLIGVGTVVFDQPIVLATAHNFFAAVLLATLLVAAWRAGPVAQVETAGLTPAATAARHSSA